MTQRTAEEIETLAQDMQEEDACMGEAVTGDAYPNWADLSDEQKTYWRTKAAVSAPVEQEH